MKVRQMQMPDAVITVWRRPWRLWRPWQWSYTELRQGREGVMRSVPVEGSAWSARDAVEIAKMARLLRTAGNREAGQP